MQYNMKNDKEKITEIQKEKRKKNGKKYKNEEMKGRKKEV